MTGITQLSQNSPAQFARIGTAASCAFIMLVSGCAEKQVKARQFPWSTFAYTRPLSPTFASVDVEGVEDEDPLQDATLDVAPPPSGLVIARSVPPRPRAPTGNSPQSDANNKPDVPQIAPQLTAAEAMAVQQQTSQSLSIAERNIVSAGGRALNATQQDLASKVRSFMTEARDAATNGDWTRARAAAKKAEVLSQELASSP